MKEIKFKFWDTSLCQFLSPESFSVDFKGQVWSKTLIKPYSDIKPIQYTGLKDKNGVEIYEGDIVKGKQFDDYFRFPTPKPFVAQVHLYFDTNISSYSTGGPDGSTEFRELEVIGNIYENPELLNAN
jgi:hypothetical protein